jgi:hypothetical protein
VSVALVHVETLDQPDVRWLSYIFRVNLKLGRFFIWNNNAFIQIQIQFIIPNIYNVDVTVHFAFDCFISYSLLGFFDVNSDVSVNVISHKTGRGDKLHTHTRQRKIEQIWSRMKKKSHSPHFYLFLSLEKKRMKIHVEIVVVGLSEWHPKKKTRLNVCLFVGVYISTIFCGCCVA